MGVDDLARRAAPTAAARRALAAGVALVLLLLAWRNVVRVRDWRDDLALWSSASRAGFDTYRVRHKLGVAFIEAGDEHAADAAQQLSRAIALRPGITEDHMWLAVALFADHRAREAWTETDAVLRSDPTNSLCHRLLRLR
jgi:hypothetical protein